MLFVYLSIVHNDCGNKQYSLHFWIKRNSSKWVYPTKLKSAIICTRKQLVYLVSKRRFVAGSNFTPNGMSAESHATYHWTASNGFIGWGRWWSAELWWSSIQLPLFRALGPKNNQWNSKKSIRKVVFIWLRMKHL